MSKKRNLLCRPVLLKRAVRSAACLALSLSVLTAGTAAYAGEVDLVGDVSPAETAGSAVTSEDGVQEIMIGGLEEAVQSSEPEAPEQPEEPEQEEPAPDPEPQEPAAESTAPIPTEEPAPQALAEEAGEPANSLAHWADGSEALKSVMAYVESVTNPESDQYMEPEDRIAVFDHDGTIYSESSPSYVNTCFTVYRVLHDPAYTPDDETREKIAQLEAEFQNGSHAKVSVTDVTAHAFADCTLDEYLECVKSFAGTKPDGSDMTYRDLYYAPMLSLITYLADHDFRIYICSGTERNLIGELAKDIPEIERDRIIGTNYSLTVSDDMKSLRLTGGLERKVSGEGKVYAVEQEIGKLPILTFGNDTGDLYLAKYTDVNGGKSFIVVNDDPEREHGNPEEAQSMKEECDSLEVQTISVKEDFRDLYAPAPDGID